MSPHLQICDLAKTYPGAAQASVAGVSFAAARGEMLALLGPSGCGKTTILRMIAGLVAPSAGAILLAGRDIAGTAVHRRGIGMVFQQYALFPHLSVAQNVSFGLEMRGVPRDERDRRVRAALEMVQLADKHDQRVTRLSGGQQQRAALARSLVIEPALLLLDEPLSNLDARLRDEMRSEIRAIQRRTQVTTLFVTHDQDEALSMADRVVVMQAGRIEQIGTPREIYDAPATRFVAGFIGEGNFFQAQPGTDGTAAVPGLGVLRGAQPLAAAATLLLRPHRIDLATGPAAAINGCTGTVEDLVYTGEVLSCRVRVGPHLLRVDRLTRAEALPRPGETVALSWRDADITVLP